MSKSVETPITFVDLETTGLDPQRHEIIEAAAIKTVVTGGQIVILGSKEYRVDPILPVDPFVAKLNGYNPDQWTDSVSLSIAMAGVFDLMRGSWHAGSNPRFDASFLEVAAEEYNWSYPRLAAYHLIDVSVLALPLLFSGEVEKLKQDSLAKHFGIGHCEHRAMADTKQCLQIFAKLNNLEIVDKATDSA